MVTVRFASREDIGCWLELVNQVKESFPGLDLEQYRTVLNRKIDAAEALAATDGSRLVGVMMFSRDSKEIEFIAVRPDCRRLGAAKALVAYMLSLFAGGSVVSVVTYREGDPMGEAARGFYKRLGFTPGRLLTVFDYPCQELTLSLPSRD